MPLGRHREGWSPMLWALTAFCGAVLWPSASRFADAQAQRIALYSGPDGKGQAVLLTDSCEDLGDRSKPGCTGIPAGTSFDNKAQSARIDGFWVLYNDKRFGPSDPIHYIVGMDKTVNLGRSSSKASSVRRVGSLTNWKKDEHLSLFQYKNFAGNEVVMNPYQPTFFGHEGIPAQSAVAINSEWTVVTEHQNFCLRAKGGAYVVMDFRKEFDLSLEMILHIRHGCMLTTGSKNSSHGGFSVVSPTLSPSGNQPAGPPAAVAHHHQAPLHSRMLQRDTNGQRRRHANPDQLLQPAPIPGGHSHQQLELDPLNKILPQNSGGGGGGQTVLQLTRDISTLAPFSAAGSEADKISEVPSQQPGQTPLADQGTAADSQQSRLKPEPVPQLDQVGTNERGMSGGQPSRQQEHPGVQMPNPIKNRRPFSPGSGSAMGNKQYSAQAYPQTPVLPTKEYISYDQQSNPADYYPEQGSDAQPEPQPAVGNSLRLPDRPRMPPTIPDNQPAGEYQPPPPVVPERPAYQPRTRIHSIRPSLRQKAKPRYERPFVPQQQPAVEPSSVQQGSEEQQAPSFRAPMREVASEGSELPPPEVDQSVEVPQGQVEEDPATNYESSGQQPSNVALPEDPRQQQPQPQQSQQPPQRQPYVPAEADPPPPPADPKSAEMETAEPGSEPAAAPTRPRGMRPSILARRPSPVNINIPSSNRQDANRLSARVRVGSRLGSPRLVPVGNFDRKSSTSNMDKLRKLKSFYPPALSFLTGNRPNNMKQIEQQTTTRVPAPVETTTQRDTATKPNTTSSQDVIPPTVTETTTIIITTTTQAELDRTSTNVTSPVIMTTPALTA